jgi:hypothetical protein
MKKILMDMHINRRLTPILLGFVCIGCLLMLPFLSLNSLTFSLVYARAGNQGHSFSAPVAYLVDFLEKHLDISHCANIEDFFNNFLGNKLLYQPGP